jgi:ATP-dependent Zn protease
MQLPEDDQLSMSYTYMTSRLAIMMGGRVAEELKFGEENITSGAASDIQQATKSGARHGHAVGAILMSSARSTTARPG